MSVTRTAARTTADATTRLAALADALAVLEADGDGPPSSVLLDDGEVARAVVGAREVLARAGRRRALSSAHTVVALAGATGGGKSSLANALLGERRMVVGARRPTTSAPVAGVVSADGTAAQAGPLLEWLGIDERHVVDVAGLEGLVLLDLPDVDSVQVSHQATVDRLAQVVDVLVWVLDPQKYADDLVHRRYLRPMAGHASVTVVVLNQADTLAPGERDAVVADLRHLLAEDGMPSVSVIVTSATTGEGLADLRAALADIVEARWAAEARLAADARAAAHGLLAAAGSPDPAGVSRADRDRLAVTLADAAGVEVVAAAAARSYRLQARRRAGWPPTRWLGRVKADPLRRLGLAREVVDPVLVRSSLPRPTPVQRARVDAAVRALGAAAATGAGEPWRSAVRSVAARSSEGLSDALDQAVVSTRLDSLRSPYWWRAFGAAQWLLLAAAVAGALWLAGLAGLGYLQLPEPETPRWGAVPWPTVLLAGGVLVGLLLAGLAGLLARAGSRRRAARVRRRLRDAVSRVADEVVVAPVLTEVRRCLEATALARRAAAD